MKLSLLYLTIKDKSTAQDLASVLLAEKLIACANIMDGVTSLYRWEGKLEGAQEVVVLLKTRKTLATRVMKRVAALHSYECPCILEFPIENAHIPFVEWVFAETAATPDNEG